MNSERSLTAEYAEELAKCAKKSCDHEVISANFAALFANFAVKSSSANRKAGMGIAFHAKPLVRQNTNHAVSHLGLDSILYLIELRDRDLDRAEFRSSSAG